MNKIDRPHITLKQFLYLMDTSGDGCEKIIIRLSDSDNEIWVKSDCQWYMKDEILNRKVQFFGLEDDRIKIWLF